MPSTTHPADAAIEYLETLDRCTITIPVAGTDQRTAFVCPDCGTMHFPHNDGAYLYLDRMVWHNARPPMCLDCSELPDYITLED